MIQNPGNFKALSREQIFEVGMYALACFRTVVSVTRVCGYIPNTLMSLLKTGTKFGEFWRIHKNR